ncbi:hypothetical protein H7I76_33395, partial [Mycolicibacterium vaccae]|nr:hypothetical protein [Mycolicibacterium vaccae]
RSAALVDHVAIIKEGRIIVTDTVENLRANAPKTVDFRFANRVDPAQFDRLDGGAGAIP